MAADWSMLLCDILGTIAQKLEQPDDFICFSAVCHSWNHASSLVKSIPNPNAVTPSPWLLLAEPENTTENPDCLRKVYNLSNNKSYRLKVPETFGARCWGSSYGWIALQTFDYQVHLLNPLTKVRITSLPSILTMSPDNLDLEPNDPPSNDPLNPDNLEDQQWYFNYFVIRLVVLKMPHNRPGDDDDDDDDDDDGNGDLLIAAIFGEFDYLAFARPGDQSWTYMVSKVTDVACLEDRIYIVRCDGQLLYCDIKGCGDLKDAQVMEYAPGCRSRLSGFDKVYLLDLCGDLVMAVRSKTEFFTGSYLTIGFNVYRLDNKKKKWVEIKDIGKLSIFVGNNSSMACPISVANKCRSNCIYFTDDEHVEWRTVSGFGGKDMGVYDIGSGSIKNFYFGDDDVSPFCPPIFFLPKCCSTD